MSNPELIPTEPEPQPSQETEQVAEQQPTVLLPEALLAWIARNFGSTSTLATVSSYIEGGMIELAQLAVSTNNETAAEFKKRYEAYSKEIQKNTARIQKAGGAIISSAGVLDPRRIFKKD